ncbi:hypothetical protein [Oceanobacillus senegalensis]|uniref:hypothetical protein n=1 Tax=Oceanobacillus senegalensis TaxID=1936063 RepID=UPI000A308EB8|nr:hypothetical protein [Oceanobacillus senegalensis]
MQEGINTFLRKSLAELNMYPVLERMNKGVSKQKIISAFEENMLYQNPQYQKMIEANMKQKLSAEQWNQLITMYKKQHLLQQPKINLVYQFLQSMDHNTTSTNSTTSKSGVNE